MLDAHLERILRLDRLRLKRPEGHSRRDRDPQRGTFGAPRPRGLGPIEAVTYATTVLPLSSTRPPRFRDTCRPG